VEAGFLLAEAARRGHGRTEIRNPFIKKEQGKSVMPRLCDSRSEFNGGMSAAPPVFSTSATTSTSAAPELQMS